MDAAQTPGVRPALPVDLSICLGSTPDSRRFSGEEEVRDEGPYWKNLDGKGRRSALEGKAGSRQAFRCVFLSFVCRRSLRMSMSRREGSCREEKIDDVAERGDN